MIHSAFSMGCPSPFRVDSNVKLGILEGPAVGYSQRSVGAPLRNPGETGIPLADLGLFSKDHPGIFWDSRRRLDQERLIEIGVLSTYNGGCT